MQNESFARIEVRATENEIFMIDYYAACSPLSLSLSLSLSLYLSLFLSLSRSSHSEGFAAFEHSSAGETCFSKLSFEPLMNVTWLDPFCSKKFDNNELFHANLQFLNYT